VWFGYVSTAVLDSFSFDLVCVAPDGTVTNENPTLRSVVVSRDMMLASPTGDLVWLGWQPSDDPVWVFVNDGEATEVAIPTFDFVSSSGWVRAEFAFWT
jgi:hypothetical protein